MISAEEARKELMRFNEMELKQLSEIDNLIRNRIKDGKITYGKVYPAVLIELRRLGYVVDNILMHGIEQISCHIHW